MRRNIFLILCSALFLISSSPPLNASEQNQLLSDKRYVDPEGFFTIIPPKGWEMRKHPMNPKNIVTVFSPSEEISLWILTQSVDLTFEERYQWTDRTMREMINKQGGSDYKIEKVDINGETAIKSSFQFRKRTSKPPWTGFRIEVSWR